MSLRWWDELNVAQQAAVEHRGSPLLIVAGAGTGKTRTLAARVAHLVDSGVPPERILLLTFTRRAAREMVGRARRMAGAEADRVWGGTFHSIAHRLLRLHGRVLGLSPGFTVLDATDVADVMDLLRNDLSPTNNRRRLPRAETLGAIYSRVANTQAPLGDVLDSHYPWCRGDADFMREVFTAYSKRKRAQNVLDLDDLLLFWRALGSSPAGSVLARLFDHVLVDEYQDTNRLQADILSAMGGRGRDVTVVGDDAQAIYSFRAASVENILEFPVRFPGATVMKLEQNYRSTPEILSVANAVLERSKTGYEKYLWTRRSPGRHPRLLTCRDETEQSEAVCESVLERRERGLALTQQAVLFRAGHHSAHLEIELNRRNIPFVKYGGLKFVDTAHIKDLLALMRILDNPFDEVSWFRVLKLLDGVGPATATRVMSDIGVRPRQEALDPLRSLWDGAVSTPSGIAALGKALRDCGGDEEPHPATQIERLRNFYEPLLHNRYEDARVRLRDLEQLGLMASAYRTRADFVADLTLDPPVSTGDLAGPPSLDEDYLILSTIHSAKGGEWEAVSVIHASDGNIPSDLATGDADQIEEERRLLYVALTRAKSHLDVYLPLRYYHHRGGPGSDAHSYAQLTRFLAGGPDALFAREARTDAPSPLDVSEVKSDPMPISAGVDRLLKDLWD